MAQGSREASKSQISSKNTLKSTQYPEEHCPNRSVLFINHYSIDGTGQAHGPDRKTVGTHVQRIIRVRKRLDAEVKLKSRTSDGSLLAFRFKDTTKDTPTPSELQTPISVQYHLCLAPDLSGLRAFSQEACKLKEIARNLLDQVTWGRKLAKCTHLPETIPLQLSEILPLSSPNGLLDSILTEAFSACKSAKIAFQYCEYIYIFAID
jgi:hypothetical protein